MGHPAPGKFGSFGPQRLKARSSDPYPPTKVGGLPRGHLIPGLSPRRPGVYLSVDPPQPGWKLCFKMAEDHVE
jgi:hypothetical protein